jgi:transposase-like protein
MYNNLLQVTSYFKNNKKCIKHLEKIRWNGNVICPYCKSDKVYKVLKDYKCGNCNYRFNVKIGTIFESSKIPLNKWFVAIYLETSFKKGISSLQLSKEIGVQQRTAWFMLHRIREMLRDKSNNILSGIVELVD